MTDRRIERRFRRSRPTGRDLAVFVDYLCGHEGMKSDDAWLRALQRRELDPRERRLAMEIAYGSMRRRRTLDWCIERAAGRPVGKIDPVALSILRTAAYQLLFMSRVPAYSAVSEAVESARNLTHKGIASFVNAVLRRISAPDFDPAYPDPECDPVGYLEISQSYPRWIVEEWVQRFGFDTAQRMLEAGNRQPQVVLRVNAARTTVDELEAQLQREGFACSRGRYVPEVLYIESGIESVESLPGYSEGLFAVQDESSMLVAYAMGAAVAAAAGATATTAPAAPAAPAAEGDAEGHAEAPVAACRRENGRPLLFVDACSAPGGKATHMATLGGDCVRVEAYDVSARRLESVRDSVKRLRLTNVTAYQLDARNLPQRHVGDVDALLVDAPCSGLGVLARRPDARWRQTPENRSELVRLQAEILDAAAKCVAPGGTLIYSTCTVSEPENEGQVEKFIAQHPEFEPAPLAPLMPTESARSLVGDGPGGWRVQLIPGVHGVDGFFIARMRRVPNIHG